MDTRLTGICWGRLAAGPGAFAQDIERGYQDVVPRLSAIGAAISEN